MKQLSDYDKAVAFGIYQGVLDPTDPVSSVHDQMLDYDEDDFLDGWNAMTEEERKIFLDALA